MKPMSAAKSFNQFKTLLAERLTEQGLHRKGDVLTKAMPEAVLVFELQKDSRNSTKEAVRFTVNVGIFLDALRAFRGDDPAQADPSAEQCHWRARLGRLTAAQADVWWTIRNDEEARVLCDEIATAIATDALPRIEGLATTDAFVDAWRSDKGQGLTEYERRANLARLLLVLGRKNEAREAMHALTAASEGKAWAAAAKVDAREIERLLD